MRKLLIMAASFTLVACGESATEEPAAEPEAVEAEAEAPAMVTANGSSPGTFDVTAADGTASTSILNADGTYQDIDADGGIVAEGTWAVAEGKTCFTDAADSSTLCWAESQPGEDGSFTATSDDGEEVTVTPAAG